MSQITVDSRNFPDVDHLEAMVIHAATEYELNGYVEDFDGIEITDPEYDALYRKLQVLRPNSKAFQGTTPAIVDTSSDVVIHDPPMTSIAKADGDKKKQIYEDWINNCATRLNVKSDKVKIVQSFKHDGVALRVNYVNGKMVSAGLRPRDGINGTDVTRHAPNLIGVPKKLSLPLTLSLNGEIECRIKDFDEVNKQRDLDGDEPYKNPRNYTAGCMGRDDPNETKNARLRVSFYSITGFDEWADYYSTEIERAKWANSKDGLNLQDDKGKGYFIQVRPHEFDHLQKMEDFAAELPYYVDGIVLKVNDLEWQEELGHTGDSNINTPRCALAWKFKEEEVEAEISHLEWNASRTGRIVPTAIFKKSINLADTDVSRATVNNYGWASNLGIGSGTKVKVKKAGKIVPNVCSVISDSVDDIDAPNNCPVCDSKLELHVSNSGNKDLLCKNKQCGAKHVHSWIFFLQNLGAKGLGASAMEKILTTGKVHSLADLYKLSENDLTDNDLFSERQATLALGTIWLVKFDKDNDKMKRAIDQARNSKIQIEAWKFFAALGISGAGKTAGKALVLHYRDFQKIRDASTEELLKVDGIGEITAVNIHDFFSSENFVNDLLECFDLELPKSGKMTGINFVFTGAFAKGKKHWTQAVENEGGNVQSSVGSSTNYLVQEYGKTDGSPSSKEQKADKLGVPIISVADLEKLI